MTLDAHKYEHLTNAEIDKYLAMELATFNTEWIDYRYNITRKDCTLEEIEENRNFLLGSPMGIIYVKRGSKLFKVKKHSEEELPAELHPTFKFVMYYDEYRKAGEMESLLFYRYNGVTGGSKYCKHTFRPTITECPNCGAKRLENSIKGSMQIK